MTEKARTCRDARVLTIICGAILTVLLLTIPATPASATANPFICELTRPDCAPTNCCDGDFGVTVANCGSSSTSTGDYYLGFELKYCGSVVDEGCVEFESDVPSTTPCNDLDVLEQELISNYDYDPENDCTTCDPPLTFEWKVGIFEGECGGSPNSYCSGGLCISGDEASTTFFSGICQELPTGLECCCE